jgi:sec-independent protein translocase protein TatA
MMNQLLLIGMPGGWEWLIILVVILLIFGGAKLPQLAKSLGQSKRAFKEGLREAEEEDRLEELQRQQDSRKNLSSMSDEELVAEARRREGLRSSVGREEGKLLK